MRMKIGLKTGKVYAEGDAEIIRFVIMVLKIPLRIGNMGENKKGNNDDYYLLTGFLPV